MFSNPKKAPPFSSWPHMWNRNHRISTSCTRLPYGYRK